MTIRDVYAGAGLTSRQFYESFTDTNDLLISVYEDFAERGIISAAERIGTTVDDFRYEAPTARGPGCPGHLNSSVVLTPGSPGSR